MQSLLSSVRALSHALFWLAAFNVLVVCLGGYDISIGPFRLVAHDLFKPLQYFNGLFFIVLMLKTSIDPRPPDKAHSIEKREISPGVWTISLLGVAVLHSQSFVVNLHHAAWAYGNLRLATFQSVLGLFTTPLPDGFYRPVGYFSLWMDQRLFGDMPWACHLQSIALHLINVYLVYRLGLGLRLDRRAAYCGAMLFGLFPSAFEAVLWPAARFDLLATTFELLALTLALRYLTAPKASAWLMAFATTAYAVSILNKESAYSFPLLLGLLALSSRLQWTPSIPHYRFLRLMVATAAVTVLGLILRIVIYGNLGGYARTSGASPNFEVSWNVLFMGVTRLFGVAPFQINHAIGLPIWMRLGIVIYVVALIVLARKQARLNNKCVLLLAGACLAAVPVISLLGWVGPTAQQARYLYWPGVFLCLFFAELILQTRRPLVPAAALALAYVLGTTLNLWIYRDMVTGMEQFVNQIQADSASRPDVSQARLIGYADNGVFYLDEEMQDRIRERTPNLAVSLDYDSSKATSILSQPNQLVYCWQTNLRRYRSCTEVGHRD
jgi:hypothetical protein